MRQIRRQNVPVDVIFCWYEELGLYRQIDVKLSLLLSYALEICSFASSPGLSSKPIHKQLIKAFVLKRSTLLTLSIAVSLGCCIESLAIYVISTYWRYYPSEIKVCYHKEIETLYCILCKYLSKRTISFFRYLTSRNVRFWHIADCQIRLYSVP